MSLDLAKYSGLWYELLHYPSWFQHNQDFNTTAEYTINPDGTVKVVNKTVRDGEIVTSIGKATYLGGYDMKVDFSPELLDGVNDKSSFMTSSDAPYQMTKSDQPNYVIYQLWMDDSSSYRFALVTDPGKQSLYLLSRSASVPAEQYSQLLSYIDEHFDIKRIVQTPHLKM
jgi:apolipoprotein D and lipocalin family protein